MKTHRETLWLWRSLALAVCSLPTSACVDAMVGEVEVCEYEGKGYALNDKFPAADGCNTCKCGIDGDVVCTEIACAANPAVCDDKYGCRDAGWVDPGQPTWDDAGQPTVCDDKYGCQDAGWGAPVCDDKYGCRDAGLDPNAPWYCKDRSGKLYKPGETFGSGDGCNSCLCLISGQIQCTDKVCYEPDGAWPEGVCVYAAAMYKLGESFVASDGCNWCTCSEGDIVECTRNARCTTDAGVGDAGMFPGNTGCEPFSCPTGGGSCSHGGKTYAVGEGFGRGDNCNKCLCVADGTIECTADSCGGTGCTLGNNAFLTFGQSVTCEDGCNTCTCNLSGMSRTEIACPALPNIPSCDATMMQLAFPAPLAYQTGDAIAVTNARCVNGAVNDFSLCYADLNVMTREVTLYVVPGATTRACAGTERVFSLLDIRAAVNMATGQMSNKVLLRGSGQDFGYAYGF
jgi:hypothetical protein